MATHSFNRRSELAGMSNLSISDDARAVLQSYPKQIIEVVAIPAYFPRLVPKYEGEASREGGTQ